GAGSACRQARWGKERWSWYERLEFLGDSVLELALADELYHRFPEFDEGQMAKVRSHVVSRASCAVVARELGLGERLVEIAGTAAGTELARLSTNRNAPAAGLDAGPPPRHLADALQAR